MGEEQVWPTRRALVYKGADPGRPKWKSRPLPTFLQEVAVAEIVRISSSRYHQRPIHVINRRIIVCVTMLIALTASARSVPAQSSDEREFVGTINKTLQVRIRLSQSGTVLSGSYAYERIGKSLRLAGEMTFENEFYLNEFDDRGRQTGQFDGKFVSPDWLEGTWSSSSTKRVMPFNAWATDGKQIPTANADDRVSGEYKRVDERDKFDPHTAALEVWLLKDGEVRVQGFSSWVGDGRTGNVNVGQVDGIVPLQGSKILFKFGDGDEACRFTITFGGGSLLVTEDNLGCGGLNVSFNGKYRKVGPAITQTY